MFVHGHSQRLLDCEEQLSLKPKATYKRLLDCEEQLSLKPKATYNITRLLSWAYNKGNESNDQPKTLSC